MRWNFAGDGDVDMKGIVNSSYVMAMGCWRWLKSMENKGIRVAGNHDGDGQMAMVMVMRDILVQLKGRIPPYIQLPGNS